jgi:hypothetical protein
MVESATGVRDEPGGDPLGKVHPNAQGPNRERARDLGPKEVSGPDHHRGLFDAVARTLTFACTSTSPGFAEEKDMAERSFDPNLERLRGLKAKYDPDDLFRGHLDVRPSTRVRIER